MQQIKIKKINSLNGEFTAPSDKSISQRIIMMGAIAPGKVYARNFLDCDDCRNAITAFKNMGIKIKLSQDKLGKLIEIEGNGLYGLKPPKSDIYLGNSGTTMRLISGILAAQKFKSVLTGDNSLLSRPMKRIIDPLEKMGAHISGHGKDSLIYPPLVIEGRDLRGIKYIMPINSAQVKSAVLIAGLYAKGLTQVQEKIKTRDHSEKMMQLFGADIRIKGLTITISGQKQLYSPGYVFIPGDISSCAFFIVAATIVANSKIIIRKVGMNSTRSYIIHVLNRMGADIHILEKESNLNALEPFADLLIQSRALKATTITEEEVAYCIDELPILCVVACFAKGTTRICNAGELRIKETDRIYSMCTNLKKMGADIENIDNDLIINGPCKLHGDTVQSFGDHRTVMSTAVAGLLAKGETIINDTECVNKSFPEFMKILTSLIT